MSASISSNGEDENLKCEDFVIPAKPNDYEALFKKLDIEKTGEISFNDFKKAIKNFNHPVSESPELLKKVFNSFDSNHDEKIDFQDFKKYLITTDDQILKGFLQLDEDHDGKLNKSDFIRYLKETLDIEPSRSNIDLLFKQLDSNEDGYITYKEFREYLLLVPRLHGSRIKTAFTFLFEEYDINSDGDVTLITQFINGFKYFLAGGLAGVVSRTCTAPFDRIKVFLIARTDLTSTILHSKSEIARQIASGAESHVIEALQMEKAAEIRAAKTASADGARVAKTIRSPIVQAVRTIWKQGGLKAFYVGNGLNVMKVFPESAMKFGSFEAAKRFFARLEGVENVSQISKVSTYLAGGFGGVIAQLTVYPVDTLKFRLQCSNLDHPLNAVSTAKEMLKDGGVRIFYRGIGVGLAGMFPYAALDLGTFSTIKRLLVKKFGNVQDQSLPTYMTLSLGAFSGSFAATIVYPINLLRTRLQSQGTYAHPYTYDGFYDVFSKTIAREGYGGLWKGLVPNLAKVAPAVSISYFVYETLIHRL
ncbi:SAL1 Calcium-binding mitochondrial carrier SAL1 [Candida maltosa Xu316]